MQAFQQPSTPQIKYNVTGVRASPLSQRYSPYSPEINGPCSWNLTYRTFDYPKKYPEGLPLRHQPCLLPAWATPKAPAHVAVTNFDDDWSNFSDFEFLRRTKPYFPAFSVWVNRNPQLEAGLSGTALTNVELRRTVSFFRLALLAPTQTRFFSLIARPQYVATENDLVSEIYKSGSSELRRMLFFYQDYLKWIQLPEHYDVHTLDDDGLQKLLVERNLAGTRYWWQAESRYAIFNELKLKWTPHMQATCEQLSPAEFFDRFNIQEYEGPAWPQGNAEEEAKMAKFRKFCFRIFRELKRQMKIWVTSPANPSGSFDIINWVKNDAATIREILQLIGEDDLDDFLLSQVISIQGFSEYAYANKHIGDQFVRKRYQLFSFDHAESTFRKELSKSPQALFEIFGLEKRIYDLETACLKEMEKIFCSLHGIRIIKEEVIGRPWKQSYFVFNEEESVLFKSHIPQLANQIVRKELPKCFLATIPVRWEDRPEDTCILCLEDLGVGFFLETYCEPLAHRFHPTCLTKFYASVGAKEGVVECPMCRYQQRDPAVRAWVRPWSATGRMHMTGEEVQRAEMHVAFNPEDWGQFGVSVFYMLVWRQSVTYSIKKYSGTFHWSTYGALSAEQQAAEEEADRQAQQAAIQAMQHHLAATKQKKEPLE